MCSLKSSTRAGTGRPLIFLAGLGDTAHVFDKFAPKFTARYHVYGITRRGFGESNSPAPTEQNYASDRLGDDVLSVIYNLHLEKPVVAGHSMAGEELSSIGSRHPEAVSGLIYLDASFPYAYYDRALGDPQLDELDVKRRIEQLLPGNGDPEGQQQAIQGLLDTLPQLEMDLKEQLSILRAIASPNQSFPPQPPNPSLAMVSGERKYTQITARCLAIISFTSRSQFRCGSIDRPGAQRRSGSGRRYEDRGAIERVRSRRTFSYGLCAHMMPATMFGDQTRPRCSRR